jgi:hypothetical protein
MKIGISLKIDVTKIDKTRLFIGKNGAKYLDLTTFIDIDNPDQYGNNGFITQSKNKDEGKDTQLPILGNTKCFWKDQSAPQAPSMPTAQSAPPVDYNTKGMDEDCPF